MYMATGNAGYKAYKYVPYGKIQEVMPYFIRIAQGNPDVLGGAKEELDMMNVELWRRFKLFLNIPGQGLGKSASTN
jgi:proline dehydrogenase